MENLFILAPNNSKSDTYIINEISAPKVEKIFLINYYFNRIFKELNIYLNKGFKKNIQYAEREIIQNIDNNYKKFNLSLQYKTFISQNFNKNKLDFICAIYDKKESQKQIGFASNKDVQYALSTLILPILDFNERQIHMESTYLLFSLLELIKDVRSEIADEDLILYLQNINNIKITKLFVNYIDFDNSINAIFEKNKIIEKKFLLDENEKIKAIRLYDQEKSLNEFIVNYIKEKYFVLYQLIVSILISLYKHNSNFVSYILHNNEYLSNLLLINTPEEYKTQLKSENENINNILLSMLKGKLKFKFNTAFIRVLSSNYPDIYSQIISETIKNIDKNNTLLAKEQQKKALINRYLCNIYIQNNRQFLENNLRLNLLLQNYLFLHQYNLKINHQEVKIIKISLEVFNILINEKKQMINLIEVLFQTISYDILDKYLKEIHNLLRKKFLSKDFIFSFSELINIFKRGNPNIRNGVIVMFGATKARFKILKNTSKEKQIIPNKLSITKTELEMQFQDLKEYKEYIKIFDENEINKDNLIFNMMKNIIVSEILLSNIKTCFNHNYNYLIGECACYGSVFIGKDTTLEINGNLQSLENIKIDKLLILMNRNIYQDKYNKFIKLYQMYFSAIQNIKNCLKKINLLNFNDNNFQSIYKTLEKNYLKNTFQSLKIYDLLKLSEFLDESYLSNIFTYENYCIELINSGKSFNDNSETESTNSIQNVLKINAKRKMNESLTEINNLKQIHLYNQSENIIVKKEELNFGNFFLQHQEI